MSNLTFVVPAYGQSPFLKDCLVSLRNQTVSSTILVATSTPNAHVEGLAKEFGVPLLVNLEGGSISRDWNYALAAAASGLVVLAHQDDLYHPEFAEKSLGFFGRNSDCAISFTDSAELIGEVFFESNKRELVKKILRRSAYLWHNSISRPSQLRRLLGFGCPIPCPSVVYNRNVIPDFRFSDRYSMNLDWDAWVRIGFAGKEIGYIRGALVAHRIHEGAETQKALADKRRDREDLSLFSRFWPDKISRLLLGLYRIGY